MASPDERVRPHNGEVLQRQVRLRRRPPQLASRVGRRDAQVLRQCRRAAAECGHAIGPAAVEVVDLLVERAHVVQMVGDALGHFGIELREPIQQRNTGGRIADIGGCRRVTIRRQFDILQFGPG